MIEATRHLEFLNRTNSRRLRGALWEPDIEMPPSLKGAVGNWLTTDMISVREMLESAGAITAQRADYPAGDLPQAVSVSFNIPWLELLCGCTARVQPDTIWTESSGLDYSSLSRLAFDPANAWFQKLLEAQEALGEFAENRFPVSLPVMHGPLDLLSAFRGPEQMCMDFLDRPAEVRQALARLTDLWIQVGQALLPLVPAFLDGWCSRMKLWLPGRCVTLQNDATALLSAAFYSDFMQEFDESIVAAFPYHTYHTHSTSSHIVRALDSIPRLATIQMTLDPNGPPRPRLREILRLVQQEKPVQLSVWDAEWAGWCQDSFEPAGTCVAYIVRDEDDWRQYENWLASSVNAGS
jgi:hypothetical protein